MARARNRYYRRTRRRMYRRLTGRKYTRPSRSFAVKVRKVVKSELKYRNQNQSNISMDLIAGLFPKLSISADINQGNLITQRIGDFITPVTNHGTVSVIADTTSPIQSTRYRLFFFVWKETVDEPVAPVIEDLLEDVLDVWSPFKISQRGTFKVLWSRKSFVINNLDNTYVSRVYNYKFNFNRISQMTYDGGAANRNHLFFYGISDGGIPNPSTYTINNIFRYTDT